MRDAAEAPKPSGGCRGHQREPQQEKEAASRLLTEQQPRQSRGSNRPSSGRTAEAQTKGGEGSDRNAELKKQITKINRLLKDVAALEKSAPESLSDAQRKKVGRKAELQREKSAVLAELNGATVESSAASSGAGSTKTRVAISL